MRVWAPVPAVVALMVRVCTAASPTQAVIGRLELKKIEGPPGVFSRTSDVAARFVRPQGFWWEQGAEVVSEGPSFDSLVKKEPSRYESSFPLKGVLRLGDDSYLFAFDGKKPEAGYERLYLDRNRNGDLTDDEVIRRLPGSWLSGATAAFPRIDLKIRVDGREMDYAVHAEVYGHRHQQPGERSVWSASGSFAAAAYREGELEIDGKKRRLVLVDFNTNGRFDDRGGVRDAESPGMAAMVYAEVGDRLYIDPVSEPEMLFGWRGGIADRVFAHYVGRLVAVDDRYYELRVTPTGDEVALRPSEVRLGEVTNPAERFSAEVYGELGILEVIGGRDRPAFLPEGQWKLLSYTIDLTERAPSTQPVRTNKPRGSLLSRLLRLASPIEVYEEARTTAVSAQAARDYKAVNVVAGRKTVLPFGPPYKPVVSVSHVSPGVAYLEMNLVGSEGEQCRSLLVRGERPAEPALTIAAPDGEIVERGKFEWG